MYLFLVELAFIFFIALNIIEIGNRNSNYTERNSFVCNCTLCTISDFLFFVVFYAASWSNYFALVKYVLFIYIYLVLCKFIFTFNQEVIV